MALERDVPSPQRFKASQKSEVTLESPAGPLAELPPDAVERALPNRPSSYGHVERSIEHLKAAVHDLRAVLVAATFHDGWNAPQKGEIQPRPALSMRKKTKELNKSSVFSVPDQ